MSSKILKYKNGNYCFLLKTSIPNKFVRLL